MSFCKGFTTTLADSHSGVRTNSEARILSQVPVCQRITDVQKFTDVQNVQKFYLTQEATKPFLLPLLSDHCSALLSIRVKQKHFQGFSL